MLNAELITTQFMVTAILLRATLAVHLAVLVGEHHLCSEDTNIDIMLVIQHENDVG